MLEWFRNLKLPMTPLFCHQPIALLVRCHLLRAGIDTILILLELQWAVSLPPVFGVCSLTYFVVDNRILLFFDWCLTFLDYTYVALFVHQLDFPLESIQE
jgi:hypothetical protein